MKKFIGSPTFKKKWRALALLFTIFLAPIILPLMFLGGCIAIWRYSKRKPNTKKRNIAIAIAIIGMLGSYAIDKLNLNYLANETGQNQVAHFASNSNNHISRPATSSSERDTVEKEKEQKEKAEKEKKEKEQKEKAEKEKKEKEQKEKAEKEKKEKEQKEKAEKEKKEKEQKEKAEKEKKEKEQKEAEEKEKKEKEQKEAEEKEKKEKEQKEAEEAKKTNEAEQAVQALEGNQVTENVAPAQTAVEQVTDPTAKANFVHRIELVQNAINVRAQQAAEASQQAQQQAQNQTISGSGYYKDINGRWHRPNGQFASKKEIANAGLAW
ncbi:hypothetical protein LPB404_09180 [Streptococcus rubneri]|uniref:hypothetical protein n=1 Tax=Streptococcus rubneri TaxID=1234680 RepID=UPI001C58BC35|nr:hypothetical protein [Streptococcus rubneri]QXW96576.1 hypothetical protein LPB404_09180 [Streptococcus rubneri]